MYIYNTCTYTYIHNIHIYTHTNINIYACIYTLVTSSAEIVIFE